MFCIFWNAKNFDLLCLYPLIPLAPDRKILANPNRSFVILFEILVWDEVTESIAIVFECEFEVWTYGCLPRGHYIFT